MFADLDQIINNIRLWNHEYYDLHETSVSDEVYDHWVDWLKAKDPGHPVLLEKSQSYDQDYEHKVPMGSLAKVKTTGEIFAKFADKLVTVTPKLDGAACSLHYNMGKLYLAVTRGRTETGKGKIITANARNIKDIPHTISHKYPIEIRGEVIITDEDWVSLKVDFSNQRNAASGGLMNKDPEEVKSRKLSFRAYKIISDGLEFNTQSHDLNCLRGWGFKVPCCDLLCLSTLDDVNDIINTWKTQYKEQGFQTDGVVIRLDNNEEYNKLGLTGNCWNGGVAYKFENESATTTITDIIWETGNFGYVTPVAVFDQVEIGGSKITRCTLNNPTWMKENGDPSIGSVVVIEKCNDIIPGLTSVLSKGNGGTSEPTHCPSCNALLTYEANVDGEFGVKMRCINSECPARFKGNILNALRKLEIKGLADSTLEKLIESGFVKKPWEIFDLDFYKLVCAGFGKRQSQNIQHALEDIGAKTTTLFAAIGLDGWGRRMFEKLQEDPYYTDQRLLAFELDYDRLCKTEGIGHVRARTLAEAFDGENSYGRIFIQEMLKRITIKWSVKKVTSQTSITGLNFLITGVLSKGRSEVESDIAAAGGNIVSGVNKKLNYLIVGALDKPTSKIKKAEHLGIPTINEEKLYEMINNES